MNEDKVKGQWKQLAGKAKAKWGKLTDDDLKIAEGNSEYLAGKVQERYGIARDQAARDSGPAPDRPADGDVGISDGGRERRTFG